MNAAPLFLPDRLAEIRSRIERAARRSGRDPARVVLVAAIKTVPLEVVREAVACGVRDLGENRVQEAAVAVAAVGSEVRWHMIGHLQRNKAGRAVELFDRIHTVDDVELAAALSRRAVAVGKSVRVMMQVNVSGEASKHGVEPVHLPGLAEAVAKLPGLVLDGLMSIGTQVEQPEEARREFVRMREVRDRTERETGLSLPELSMGMSSDFEVAVEEGSTLVRIGTALFGSRR